MRSATWALGVLVVSSPVSTHAVESWLAGNMQVQGTYAATDGDGESRWTMQSPDTWLGVEVVERLQGSRFVGVWQFDLDPLADDPAGGTRQMYLEWQQSMYRVRGGRMRTLEERYLVRPITIMHGVGLEGTFTGRDTQTFINRTLQVEVSSAEMAFIGFEWQIGDQATEDTIDQWATAIGMDTPEGTVSVSYRDDNEEAGLWGAGFLWRQQPWSFGGSYLYRSQTLSWDIVASYGANSVVTKFGYGRDHVKDVSYWTVGVDQRFTGAIQSYSELRWRPSDDDWLWQTGFRLSF